MDENELKVEIFDIIEKQGKLQADIKELEMKKRDKLIELDKLRS